MQGKVHQMYYVEVYSEGRLTQNMHYAGVQLHEQLALNRWSDEKKRVNLVQSQI